MGAGKSTLAIEEYDPNLDPENVTVIIFVRHGTSCANVRKKASRFYQSDFKDILDPGLTRKGLYDARIQGKKFRGKLESNYGNITPTVYASVLLRAQMTAYLMMNSNLKSDYTITILPYISETGITESDDNKPRGFLEQEKILQGFTPVFEKMIRKGYNNYTTKDKSDKVKPDLMKFIDELHGLCEENANEKKIKSVPTTRCSVKNKMINVSEQDTRTAYAPIIIVTHGHVLEQFFKEIGRPIKKPDRPNFVAFRVYYNHATKHFIKNPNGLPYLYPYDKDLTEFKLNEECEYEKRYQACESDVCDPNANVTSTMHIGGRTRKRMRRKGRKRTQKNS